MASQLDALAAESNIYAGEWPQKRQLVEHLLRETQTTPDVVEAVSELRDGGVLVLFQTWHAVARAKGMFAKRIEIVTRAAHIGIVRVESRQTGVRGRDGMIIDGFDSSGHQIFELNWSSSGPAIDDGGESERDRVAAILGSCIERLAAT
jgi:hypothetical protein